MPDRKIDPDLQFGLAALRLGRIDARQFAEACEAWSCGAGGSWADLLRGRGWVSPSDVAAVEAAIGAGDDGLGFAACSAVDPEAETAADPSLGRALASTLAGPNAPAADPEVSAPAPDPDPRHRYTLLRLHAQGGLGRVWLAFDPVLGRDVALKELRPERAGDPSYQRRFVQEAQVTGQLEHPGIVTVHDLAGGPRVGPRAFYTMRFVQGRTLTAAIRAEHEARRAGRAGALGRATLLNALVAVCDAMAYAHSRRVAHRDLKPQNVVLGDFGEVVVLDWGLAKLLDHPDDPSPTPPVEAGRHAVDDGLTLPGQSLGTPGYMAPEQIEGRPEATGPASDVYSLGAILYEILTGEPPFRGDDLLDTMRRAREEEPAPPRRLAPDAPRALEAVCLKALARRPEARYAAAGDLARDLRRWLADEPVSAYRDPAGARLGRWARRHRTAVTAAAALLATAVVALAAATLRVGHEQARTEAALHEQTRQKRLAHADFLLARGVVDALYRGIDANPLFYEPRMDPVRLDLTRTTLDFYQRLAATHRDDPDLLASLAGTELSLARATLQIGVAAEAIDHGRQALTTLQGLTREHPDRRDFRNSLAQCHLDLAYAYQQVHRMDRAEEAHRSAVAVWKDMARDDPRDTRGWAVAANALGVFYQHTDRPDLARAAHLQARALLERLVADDPHPEPALLRSLAECHRSLANVAYRQREYDEADRSLRAAERVLAGAEGERSDPRNLNQLAYDYQLFGKVRVATGRTPEAVAYQEKAARVWRQLSADHPDNVEYSGSLANTLHHLGDLRASSGPPGEAAPCYREAASIWERLAARAPDQPQLRDRWARDLFCLGKLDLAAGRQADAVTHLKKAQTLWEALEGNARKEYERDYRDELRRLLPP